jgi:hypothetical protein
VRAPATGRRATAKLGKRTEAQEQEFPPGIPKEIVGRQKRRVENAFERRTGTTDSAQSVTAQLTGTLRFGLQGVARSQISERRAVLSRPC